MRILHTADWHMNNSLGRVDLSNHIVGTLEQIAQMLEEHRVDVMLVAGDLFSERSRPDQMKAAVSHIKRLFTPFLARGGTIAAIAGNHDSETFFETLRDALDLVSPQLHKHNGLDATGRLYLVPNPRLLRLADPSGQIVQIGLLPYPTPRCYLRGEEASYSSVEEKHRKVQAGFVAALQLMQSSLDVSLPSVLASHIHVRGAQTHSLYKISEADDVVFEPSDVPAHFAYVAYGHIHKPGPVGDSLHVRYCGSVARLDAAERDDQKEVVMVDVGAGGRLGEAVSLPLRTTPFYQIEITDPEAQMPRLREDFPHHESALVHLTLHWTPARHNLGALQRELSRVFPFCYGRRIEEVGRDRARLAFAPHKMSDVRGTTREFLRGELEGHPSRDELLQMAEELLAGE